MPNGWFMKSAPAERSAAADLDRPPPLRVWAAVAVVALLLAAAVWPSYRKALRDGDFLDANRPRIAEFAADQELGGAGPRIVALGNSLLYRGIWFDGTMATVAARYGAPNWHFLRIVRSMGGYRNFTPLFEPILAARPDLLILQSDLLLENVQPIGYGEYLSYSARSWLRQATGRPSLQRTAVIDQLRDREDNPPFRRSDAVLARYVAARPYALPLPAPARAEIEELLLLAKAAGIRVVVLDLPRSAASREAVAVCRRGSGGDATEAWLRQGDLATWLECPLAFDDDCFYDYAHLNAAGRDKLVSWLVGALARELKSAGDGQ